MIKPVSHAGRKAVPMSGLRSGIAEPRRSTQPAVAVAAVALICLAASGCGSSGVHAQTGPIPSTSATGTTSTSTSTPDPSARQQAVAGAIAQVGRYESLLDDLAIHPHRSLNQLYRVSTQPDVTQEIGYLNHFREAGDRQTGHVHLSATRAVRVALTNHPKAHRPIYPTVVVTTCIKVSGVKTFNAHGTSTTAKSRKPYFLTHLTLINVKYPAPDQWLVKSVTDTEVRTCGA
jgi:hypothetical protein